MFFSERKNEIEKRERERRIEGEIEGNFFGDLNQYKLREKERENARVRDLHY